MEHRKTKWLTSLVGLAGALVAACLSQASAQSRPLEGQQVVLYTFGGTQLAVTKELVIEPFEKETGAKVVIDDSCCTKLQAAIESGEFIGDVVVGLSRGRMLSMNERGFFLSDARLEKIARDLGSPFPSASMMILHKFALVIAAKDNSVPLPKNWAEFWDVKKFPGTRALVRSDPWVQLEAALLADGVAPDKLYPLDVERAFTKLNELKKSTKIVFNASGADQINNLGTGEVTYGITYSNRAYLAKRDKIAINFDYSDGFLQGNGGAILKGARNIDGAVAFLEYHMRPEVLARFAERTGMAPVYPQSSSLIAKDVQAILPTSPDNAAKQHELDDEFWQKNLEQINRRWVEWLAQ